MIVDMFHLADWAICYAVRCVQLSIISAVWFLLSKKCRRMTGCVVSVEPTRLVTLAGQMRADWI